MQIDTITLIIAIASFIGVILGPVTTNLITARQAAVERQDAIKRRIEQDQQRHRQDKIDRLSNALKTIISLRGFLTHDYVHDKEGVAPKRGELIAILRSLPYQELRDFAENAHNLSYISARESNKAIDDAIIFLGDQIWSELNSLNS